MIVKIGERKTRLRFRGKLKTLLSRLSINPETVVVVRGSTLITSEHYLSDKDSIEVLNAVSRG